MKTEISTRKRIRIEIKNWFKQFRPGDQLTTTEVVKRCHKYISKQIDPGTIRRELRFMRNDGLINYKSIGERREKIIRILNID